MAEPVQGQYSRSSSSTRWPYRGAIANRKIGFQHVRPVTFCFASIGGVSVNSLETPLSA